jgi:hypothetical protein
LNLVSLPCKIAHTGSLKTGVRKPVTGRIKMPKLNRLIAIIMVLSLVVTALSGCHGGGLPESDRQAIISAAVSYQTEGNVYHADSYEVVKLKKGEIIYGLLPGQSVFYADKATVDKGNGSYKSLYALLQVRPHPVYGYRTKLGKYEAQADMYVASGICRANTTITIDGKTENLGAGGGFQYVVFDYTTKLKLLEETDLHE